LVAKKQQARLLLGCPSSGERADAAHQGLILLHNGRPTDVDFPAPELMFKPGYYLRSDVIWSKLNPMPESVTDRPTKAHEYLFLLAKQERYYYDAAAIREPALMSGVPPRGGYNNKGTDGISCPDFLSKDDHFYPDERNRRSVWTIATQPYPEAHFATFPEALVEPCIMAGSRVGDTVLDPFMGSGTVARVAQRLGRDWIGCELSEKYAAMIEDRTKQSAMVFE
jgi:DNA modification methylase